MEFLGCMSKSGFRILLKLEFLQKLVIMLIFGTRLDHNLKLLFSEFYIIALFQNGYGLCIEDIYVFDHLILIK